MKFLRFGKIPENGKSINFLKMTNQEVEDFSDDLRMGYVKEAFDLVPEEAYEDGLSVFKMDSNSLPVVGNMRLIYSLCARLDEPIYIVTGKEVGEGNDREPLVEIEGVEPVEIAKERLVSLLLDTLKKGFTKMEYDASMDFRNNEINVFYTKGYEEFCFNGWTFSNPVSGFDSSTGVKGRA